jgi:TetR/AcrR family transcriptional regulator
MSANPQVIRTPRATTLRRQEAILAEAERQFARLGFEGVSLDSIAAALDLSRQNLLYHWPSKEELYRGVLDDVMREWLGSMSTMADAAEPREAIEAYVAAKLHFSRVRPTGNAVFTREIMAGAPRYASVIREHVQPGLQRDVARFERWAAEGRIQSVNFTHLMFLLWASTQAYADLGPQFALLVDKAQLDDQDFAAAQELIVDLIWSRLAPRRNRAE